MKIIIKLLIKINILQALQWSVSRIRGYNKESSCNLVNSSDSSREVKAI